jgi:tripartite-type tricarboxylate transporter receptor subunit TctC
VHPSLPVKTVKELIAYAKARPGKLNYAAASGSTQLAAELFKAMTGVNIVHIPYKNMSSALTDLMSGYVTLMMGISAIAPLLESGKLRALAVTTSEPSALYPGLPTVAATVPGYDAVSVTVLLAPAKTPEAIINRLNQEAVRFVNTPQAKERFLSAGTEAVGNSPDKLAAQIKAEMAKLGKVIKDAGIKVN